MALNMHKAFKKHLVMLASKLFHGSCCTVAKETSMALWESPDVVGQN
jgi:hypothetical protein